MHEYTPANTPGLPAGWEINLFDGHNYSTLSLWRVIAFLRPYKEESDEENALTYSSSRYADAELPEGYTEDNLAEAIQELIWKATQLDDMVDDFESNYPLSDLYPLAVDRPSKSEYFEKYFSYRMRK